MPEAPKPRPGRNPFSAAGPLPIRRPKPRSADTTGGGDDAWRAAAEALGYTADEIADMRIDPAPTEPARAPSPRLPEPSEEELAAMDRGWRVGQVWQAWKVEQTKRCNTIRFRRMMVDYLDKAITGDEQAVPDGVWEHLDTIVALDAGETPDRVPEMHPGFAATLYREIQADLVKPQRRRRVS